MRLEFELLEPGLFVNTRLIFTVTGQKKLQIVQKMAERHHFKEPWPAASPCGTAPPPFPPSVSLVPSNWTFTTLALLCQSWKRLETLFAGMSRRIFGKCHSNKKLPKGGGSCTGKNTFLCHPGVFAVNKPTTAFHKEEIPQKKVTRK